MTALRKTPLRSALLAALAPAMTGCAASTPQLVVPLRPGAGAARPGAGAPQGGDGPRAAAPRRSADAPTEPELPSAVGPPGTAVGIAPPPSDSSVPFEWGGSVRTRYARLWNQFRPGLDENDQALSFRTLLHAGAELGGGFSLHGEIQDARAYLTDENSGVSPIVVNTLALLQAYVGFQRGGLRRGGEGGALDLRLGAQTIDLGGRRLVARQRYRDTLQNYLGASVRITRGDGELFAFYTLPGLIQPDDRDGLLDNEHAPDEFDFDLQFWGLFHTQRGLPSDLLLETYLFGLHERDDAGERQTADREIYTPGFRVLRTPRRGAWDFELEGTVQLGSRSASPAATAELDVFAFFTHAAVGYTWDAGWRPRLAMALDLGSGESSPNDGDWDRFDSLFAPRRAELGPTGIYGPLRRENTISFGPFFGARFDERLEGFLSWRANYLSQDTDQFGFADIQDPTGSSGSFAGHQLEACARYWLVPGRLRLELGAAAFEEGRFLRNAPNADLNGDPVFVYCDLECFL